MKHTLETIAKLAGVSRGTVSRIVNGQPGVKETVRNKVLRIIAETGYYPNAQARSLAGGKTDNIGVIVFSSQGDVLKHHLFYEVLQGIQTDSAAHHYDLLLFANRSAADREYWKRIGQRRKVDGLIIMGEQIQQEYLAYYRQCNIPFVLVGKREYEELPLVCVTSDYRAGARDATRHLLAQGRKRIVFIQGLQGAYHERERYAGYAEALAEAGLRPNEQLLVQGEADEAIAYKRIDALLEQRISIDGIFAGNDLMALGAMKALQDKGLRVPADVSVVGYDDISAAAYASPPLTTIRQDKVQLGREAIKLLLKMLTGKLDWREPLDAIVPCELVVREST